VPAVAAVAAGGQDAVVNPVAVPNQKLAEDPAKTSDLAVASEGDANKVEAPVATESEAAPVVEAPKVDFSIGLGQTDAEKEAAKRAERAKRFGISVDDEEQRKLDRAKKFGTDEPSVIVKGLDNALPERRAKRGREGAEKETRGAKRQTPDRRTQAPKPAAKAAPKATAPVKKPLGRILDDPVEKAKAEARAKKFGTST
jgi:SAP domain-containing ribonucleoprotein